MNAINALQRNCVNFRATVTSVCVTSRITIPELLTRLNEQRCIWMDTDLTGSNGSSTNTYTELAQHGARATCL